MGSFWMTTGFNISILHDGGFNLISDGRSFERPVLRYSEQYTAGDIVKRAGKSLLVSIPAFIGTRFKIEKDEIKREFDIDTRYARTNEDRAAEELDRKLSDRIV